MPDAIRAVKSALKKALLSRGYSVKKTAMGSMEGALENTKARGHSPKTIIDVGASNGSWTALSMKYFPFCQYLLVEAQPTHAEALSAFRKQHPNAHVIMAAAGESPGRIHFDATDPLGGQASQSPYPFNNIEVAVTTIDDGVKSADLSGPYLIKLDTHGFELPILRGAAETLKATDVIIMECYNFRIAPDCLLFFEMCEHLRSLGFRCIDMVDPLYRPYDKSFWQMDLVFVRHDRPEFAYSKYQ